MKHFFIHQIAWAICIITICSCKKSAPNLLFEGHYATVEFQFDNGKVLSGETIEISPTDSLIVTYKMTHPTKRINSGRYLVNGEDGATNLTNFKIDADGKTITGVQKFFAKDLGAGLHTYRFWPVDINNIYLGDGDKKICINVTNDIELFTNRFVYMLSDTTKTLQSFVCLSPATGGKILTYNEAKLAPQDVDFYFSQIVRDSVYKLQNPARDSIGKYIMWGLFAPTEDFKIPMYDLQPLPVRKTTLFASTGVENGGNIDKFVSTHKTGAALTAIAEKKTYNRTWVPFFTSQESVGAKNKLDNLFSKMNSKFIYLKTQEGRLIVVYVNVARLDIDRNRVFVNISWRMQKTS